MGASFVLDRMASHAFSITRNVLKSKLIISLNFSNISSSLKLLELISGIDETSTEFSSIAHDKRVETVKGYALKKRKVLA